MKACTNDGQPHPTMDITLINGSPLVILGMLKSGDWQWLSHQQWLYGNLHSIQW